MKCPKCQKDIKYIGTKFVNVYGTRGETLDAQLVPLYGCLECLVLYYEHAFDVQVTHCSDLEKGGESTQEEMIKAIITNH